MASTAMKKMWIPIAVFIILVICYLALAIFPYFFIGKGLKPETAENLTVVAHRGGAGLGLENTLACMEKGIAAGADMVEVDVHMTKDGHLLVCHDETVNRTTDGKGRIAEMTLDEIRKFRMTDSDGNATQELLPTLEEVMSLVGGRAQLLIEVKKQGDMYHGIERKLVEEIEAKQAFSWVSIQSFNDSVLENLHGLNRSLRLEKLIVFKLPGLPVIFDGSLTRFSFGKYDYIASFNIFYKTATRAFVKNIRRHNKEVKVWTVDDPADVPRLPVNGVITDRPDLWRK